MNKIQISGRLGQNGLIWTIALLFFATTAVAQTESDSTDSDSGKGEASIELRYTEANNNTKLLEAIVKTKVEGSWQGVNGVPVQFYRNEAIPEQLLGTVASNDKGVAMLILPEDEEKHASPTFEYTYIAALENNEQFEDSQEEITVAESGFEMTLEEEDSVRQVRISLTTMDAEGNEVPAGEVEVQLYVQRLFGLLPLSDDPETTDEDGEVLVEFPADIPGDTAGNLIIVAKIEDHERFGNLEFRRKINWGVPLIIDPHQSARELWSSRANAPIYLIVIVNTMLIGIWGVILYIVYQAFKIRKIGRNSKHAPDTV
jgi:hypothetical protein